MHRESCCRVVGQWEVSIFVTFLCLEKTAFALFMKWQFIEQRFFHFHLQCKNSNSKAFILLQKEVDIPFLLISDPISCSKVQCKIYTSASYSAVMNNAMTSRCSVFSVKSKVRSVIPPAAALGFLLMAELVPQLGWPVERGWFRHCRTQTLAQQRQRFVALYGAHFLSRMNFFLAVSLANSDKRYTFS